MNRPLSRLATRAAYGASQLPRIAWYLGHGLAMTWIAQRARESGSARPRPHTDAPIPDRKRFFADMGALWQQDLANVEAGVYPLPADHDGSLKMLLHRSRLFFEDLPAIRRRRESGDHSEVLSQETRGERPRYSPRQALPPLREVFAGRDQRRLSLLDVGCGTGRFLDFVKQSWPRMPALGLDLSEAYVKEAKRHLQRWSRTDLMVGNAESIPLPDESQDAVTSIFMFHELPPKVRRIVLSEFARVLKPGGRLVLVDSLQHGDEPDYDGLLELFPQSFHEPYYLSYIKKDFAALCQDRGLTYIRNARAFVSKVIVFDKLAGPAATATRAV